MKLGKKRVLKWSQRCSWERVFRKLLADKINDAVIEEARRINPRPIADDKFAWLDSLVATITNQRPECIPALLAKRLSNHYEFVIAFHGTRSESAASFLDHGMNLSDIKYLEQRAIELFGNGQAVQDAILELRQSGYAAHNQGNIFLELTKEVFLGSCNGYLIDGCDYIATIANRIHQNDTLWRFSKPMIVECLIPGSSLYSEFWRARSYAMLEDYFTRILRPSESHRVKPSAVVVTAPIPAENILCVHEFTEFKRHFRQYNHYAGKMNEWVETTFRPFRIWPGRAIVEVRSVKLF